MTKVDKLDKYKSMRDADKTPEPFTSDDVDPEKLYFVIQKHQATALHYDFRFEVDGVMPSWPVPKGPTLDPAKKRLAMKTEDHPLDYRHFEGVIPKGEYGGGPVMIWDHGTYWPEREIAKGVREEIKDKKEAEEYMLEAIEKGEIKFRIYGTKINGSFALVKTKGFGPKNSWLLIKHRDEYAVDGWDAVDHDYSATTNRSIKEIEDAG